jgi:hypothetical protein
LFAVNFLLSQGDKIQSVLAEIRCYCLLPFSSGSHFFFFPSHKLKRKKEWHTYLDYIGSIQSQQPNDVGGRRAAIMVPSFEDSVGSADHQQTLLPAAPSALCESVTRPPTTSKKENWRWVSTESPCLSEVL